MSRPSRSPVHQVVKASGLVAAVLGLKSVRRRGQQKLQARARRVDDDDRLFWEQIRGTRLRLGTTEKLASLTSEHRYSKVKQICIAESRAKIVGVCLSMYKGL